jgi:thioesterase domain-containing protein
MATWPWERYADVVVTLAGDLAAQMRRPFQMRPEDLEGLEPDEQVGRVMEALHTVGAVPANFDAATLAERCRIVEDRKKSRSGYVPGRFSGTLTLFRASDVPTQFEEFLAPYTDEERRTLAWARYVAGPVDVHLVPGKHATLGSEPHVRVLVERLRESLAAARLRAGYGGPGRSGGAGAARSLNPRGRDPPRTSLHANP